MVRITYCSHCECWSAIFSCPKCKSKTRCSEVSDIWADYDGRIDEDELPLVECGECGFIAEIGELLKDSPEEVKFSIEDPSNSSF